MSGWRSPHDFQFSQQGKRNALIGAIALSLTALLIQLLGAWYTSSIALLGDSAHLFTDLLSLVMSLSAVIIAARPVVKDRTSFGLFRLEVLASFVNGLLLLGVSLSLGFEGILRLSASHPAPVKSLPLLLVASVGLLFNLASAGLLFRASKADPVGGFQPVQCAHGHHHEHGHSHDDRNLQSALLHVWSDALSSLAVILGAVLMYFTDFYWVDACIAVGLALWILRWATRVILDSGHVLLEGTPRHVQTEKLVSQMRDLDERVERVDDLHVWELTSRMYAATAEIRVKSMSLEQAEILRNQLHQLMRDNFGIAHVVLAIRPK